MTQSPTTLPMLLAGPIVRHVSASEFTLWWVTSSESDTQLIVNQNEHRVAALDESQTLYTTQVGARAFIHLAHLTFATLNDLNTPLHYDLQLNKCSVFDSTPALLINGQRPAIAIPHQLSRVVHGSCRKLHHDERDALVQLEALCQSPQSKPDVVFFTGDQVYIDDVAGPTLHAIQQVIALLGLHNSTLFDAPVAHAYELFEHPYNFYQREKLLPKDPTLEDASKTIFKGKRKPVFTSVHAQNHLITFAEVIGLYLLTWSDTLWHQVTFDENVVAKEYTAQYRKELVHVRRFIEDLPAVRRGLTAVPVYMIFDDHDVTDDWNLTRGWEAAIYAHPFSKRMIGNALLGYLLCQGGGNQPSTMAPLLTRVNACCQTDKFIEHDAIIDELLAWDNWHYSLQTQPPVRVLDTRTQRWRSESRFDKPSGLMDWETLVAFQQSIIDHKHVIVVSAAPIYGMKFIEMIQRLFTWFGQALTVDAENWMAHRGTANVILNIFKHIKTPQRFVILSGDVHYSFVYDVKLRFRRNSPQILQFTASGIKNKFPDKLINAFDWLNSVFYSYHSPLNWFTKRRRMQVTERYPQSHPKREMLNATGLGILELPSRLDNDIEDYRCIIRTSDGKEIAFKQR